LKGVLVDLYRPSFICADRNHGIEEIQWIAGPKVFPAGVGNAEFSQVLKNFRIAGKISFLENSAKDFVEFWSFDGLNVYLVSQASEKGLIAKFAWVQVGGKDNHELKRNLELDAVAESQVIHAPIEGNNPPIQEVLR
jgi:hypothetical protein